MNLRISRTLFQWIWIHLTGVLLVGFWPLFGLSPRCSDLVSLAKFPSNLHLSKVNKIFIVDVSTGTSNNALFSPQTQSVGQNSLRNQRSWLKAWTTLMCDLSGNFWLKEPLKGPKFFKVSHFEGWDAGDSPVVIAKNRNGGAFTVFPQFRSNYSATIPASLNLRRAVAEEPDFIYSIEVSFLRNNLPQPGLKDVVQVKVRGKHLKLF